MASLERAVRATVGAVVLAAAMLASSGVLAGADSFTPVRLTITIAPTARLDKSLPISVQVSADAGVLDSATAPLRIRAKLAGECGGTFDTTPGPVLIDKQLSPQPATGHAYQATARGSGTPTSYGVQTVCAFLEEEGDNRQFANNTANPPTVDVLEPCTVAAARYDTALARLKRTERKLRHAKRHAKRARLGKQVARQKKAVAADLKAARAACGPGVAL